MNPFVFQIGEFGLRWYSLFIMIGILLVLGLSILEAKKFKIRSDFIVNLVFWACVFGFVGARLYFVLFHADYYKIHPNEIFKVWDGGLAIHGGLLFGFITVLIYCKKYKVNPLLIFDIVVPYLLLAQALGRWGNFFNSEAYGVPTTLGHLRSLHIPGFIIQGMFIDGVYYTPTFFYESLWCLIGFIVLMIIRHIKYIKIGMTGGAYLMWYSLGRFFIEGLRTDSLMFHDFRVAQIMSVILFVVGFVLIIVQSQKPTLEALYNKKEKVDVVNF